jgi:DNA-binding NarL/FixJ family response regulator
MKAIRLLIADDHNILRQGLVDILKNYEDICIVAEAENGTMLIKKYDLFKPDVVLADIEMPEISGIEAAEKILSSYPDAKFLFLSQHFDEEYIYKIDSIGGKGLVSKEIIKDELVNAIRTVARSEKYFMGKTQAEVSRIKDNYDKLLNESTAAALTQREISILQYIAGGLSSEEIAEELHIGKRTIDFARTKIMKKLDIDTSNKLLIYAIENKEKLKLY